MVPTENLCRNNPQTKNVLEHLANELADLQIVEGFLSAVERKFLQFSNLTFDVKKAKDSLATIQDLQENGLEEDFYKAEKLLLNLLIFWRKNLIERDSAIEIQQIRRFSDDFKKPFDSKVFIALARFYRTQPHSLSTQSKYDFVVTRAFLKPNSYNNRELQYERDEIIKRLHELTHSWNIHTSISNNITDEVLQIITRFDEFIFEADFITTFEGLVNSRLFENLREFKTKIGEMFYHPSITASAIECNVFVGNIFAELLAQENEKLSRIVSNEFDFAHVLTDPSPTALNTSNKILEQIKAETLSRVNPSDEDATQIWEWLQTVCNKEDKSIQANESQTVSEENNQRVLPAKERISHLLGIISQPHSDKTELLDYLHKSPSLKSLEMGIFLSPDAPEAEKDLFLSTLKAVIWTEELRNNELMKHGSLSSETSTEISLILDDLQTLSTKLKTKIDEMETEVTHNLLYVSNQLLETRLKLERAIVRYSKQNLDHSKVVEEKETSVKSKRRVKSAQSSFTVNRWLLAATILVILISGGMYFFVNNLTGNAIITKDIENIDLTSLPVPENWKAAQRVRNTLYLTANESWKGLDEKKQEEILRSLLDLPSKKPLSNVIITDNSGDEVGNATREQIETWKKISNPATNN